MLIDIAICLNASAREDERDSPSERRQKKFRKNQKLNFDKSSEITLKTDSNFISGRTLGFGMFWITFYIFYNTDWFLAAAFIAIVIMGLLIWSVIDGIFQECLSDDFMPTKESDQFRQLCSELNLLIHNGILPDSFGSMLLTFVSAIFHQFSTLISDDLLPKLLIAFSSVLYYIRITLSMSYLFIEDLANFLYGFYIFLFRLLIDLQTLN